MYYSHHISAHTSGLERCVSTAGTSIWYSSTSQAARKENWSHVWTQHGYIYSYIIMYICEYIHIKYKHCIVMDWTHAKAPHSKPWESTWAQYVMDTWCMEVLLLLTHWTLQL